MTGDGVGEEVVILLCSVPKIVEHKRRSKEGFAVANNHDMR